MPTLSRDLSHTFVGCLAPPPGPYYFELDSDGVISYPAPQPVINIPVTSGDTVEVSIAFAILPSDWVAAGLAPDAVVDTIEVRYADFDTTGGSDILQVVEEFTTSTQSGFASYWTVNAPGGGFPFSIGSSFLAAGGAFLVNEIASTDRPTPCNVLRVYYHITAAKL